MKDDGDADNDMNVDGDDLGVWKSQFGVATIAPASAVAVSPTFWGLVQRLVNPPQR